MRITALIFVLTLIRISSYCQTSNTEKTYTGEAIYMVFLDDKNEIVSTKPLGKTPYIFYDEFFKNCTVFYFDENGAQQGMSFKYVNTTAEGFVRMKQSDSIFIFFNSIADSGKLSFLSEDKIGKYYCMLLIDKVVKK